MYFSQQQILKNNPNENYKEYAHYKKKIKMINLFDNEFIVYSCGYVFKKTITNKWKLMNLNKNNNGYIRIVLKNKKKERRTFKLHRIVYYAFNMERFDIYDTSMDNSIDHINGNKSDNRISNLRNVTHQHNTFNTKAKGYSFHKRDNKYQAKIKIDGKVKHLGYFKTKTGAKLKYFFSFFLFVNPIIIYPLSFLFRLINFHLPFFNCFLNTNPQLYTINSVSQRLILLIFFLIFAYCL